MRKHIQKKEKGLFYGRWRRTAFYKGTNRIASVMEGPNLIVTCGKEHVGKMLTDVSGYDIGLTYCSIGTTDTAPVVGNTALNNEVARKAVTSKTQGSSPNENEFTWSTFFSAGESTYNIKEVGIFGHSTATVTLDSGVLFSHYLESFDNSAGDYDLIFDYVLTIG